MAILDEDGGVAICYGEIAKARFEPKAAVQRIWRECPLSGAKQT